ncbi:MAG TPA: DUF1800 family protein, partial [Rudaea sp.]
MKRFPIRLLLLLLTIGSAHAQLSHAPDGLLHDGFEGVEAGPFSDADAARFLAQATFGPNSASIASLRALGYSAWLDQQFNAPVSLQTPYLTWVEGLPSDNDVTDDTRMQIWGINAVGTPDPGNSGIVPTDQLRQRVAFALSEILVVSDQNTTLSQFPDALAYYYDILIRN